MIKNLLEQDAAESNGGDSEKESTTGARAFETGGAPQYVEVNEAEDLLEMSAAVGAPNADYKPVFARDESFQPFAETSAETQNLTESSHHQRAEKSSETFQETENFTSLNSDSVESSGAETAEISNDFNSDAETDYQTPDFIIPAEPVNQSAKTGYGEAVFQKPAEPQSLAETARQSGLAYAAAVTLFASVVFMLIVGWFADLLFGSSPWGKVGGIVVGSLIGFIQLFRITSQIFKKEE